MGPFCLVRRWAFRSSCGVPTRTQLSYDDTAVLCSSRVYVVLGTSSHCIGCVVVVGPLGLLVLVNTTGDIALFGTPGALLTSACCIVATKRNEKFILPSFLTQHAAGR